ncbi:MULTISPECIES: nitrile hydratase subunit alpha [unclassified Roseofilum]|uniref:nitrile hydratase subunit alpha n=1 Tax=unclassified Roseofilum TaxID=2620099 RepID=UPI000E872DC4|nr:MULTISPECIES: nitrile hydratase subunit alpha [unclassified Roseofilum]MBP0010591.1 nitrile hydratase subunit alpha [Roseofilum sp. Belize Diploria]MBP0035043.1 nitrile hydratase subunit alpha [Roseofilum sp. Belize BBD 4]HBR00569.1 nitrile hydratase subunit alpha [Cyanobacteria bacterium UBA11691]
MPSLYEGFQYDPERERYSAAKVKALESLLIEKGVIAGDTVDNILSYFETQMGPFNGAKLVAKAWVDPAFKELLVNDCNAACNEMSFPPGMSGAEGEHMRVAENTPEVHNVIVCTLCSCYPWPTLGLPPYWYKDPTFRARTAREPRTVLKEFGVELDDSVEIRVWDTSGQIRWWVLPMRPEGTEGMNEEQLASLLTPEAMMGVALPKAA